MSAVADLPPGLILIVGALLVPLLGGVLRRAWMLALPLAGFAQLLVLGDGTPLQFDLFGLMLQPVRVDALALAFGYIFHIAAFLGIVYGLHEDDPTVATAGLIYAGSAVGAAFAGDLVTLFVYWELTALSSVFLILARRTDPALAAAIRYLMVQIGSGLLLMAGIAAHALGTGSIAFGAIGLDSPGGGLILLAIGVKCAFPLLHNWLTDAYPEAPATGAVWLSAFTTKLAVYALARGYPGTELLIWIGVAMAVFPLLFCAIENDLRRVLAYSLVNQLGFLVIGVGVGTELALNGTVAHAYAHILYKSLLFMAMGAVLLRTGTCRATELGGLARSMPWTATFCVIGAAASAAVPLFSSFVTKSLIISGTAEAGYQGAWLVLVAASAGVLLYPALKVPYFAFFARDRGLRVAEAPAGMLAGMGLAAALCVGIGIMPGPLFDILPYPVDYHAYTVDHVLTQVQLLVFAALAFFLLRWRGLYPAEVRGVNLDADWLYRQFGSGLARGAADSIAIASRTARDAVLVVYGAVLVLLVRHAGPSGIMARTWSTGDMALWAVVMLALSLLLFYGQ